MDLRKQNGGKSTDEQSLCLTYRFTEYGVLCLILASTVVISLPPPTRIGVTVSKSSATFSFDDDDAELSDKSAIRSE